MDASAEIIEHLSRRLTSASELRMPRPTSTPVTIAAPAVTPNPVSLVDIQIIGSDDGTLGIAEASKHFGFDPKRIYFLTDLNKRSFRGAHGHKQLRQFIVCVHGTVTLEIIAREHRVITTLDHYSKGAILRPGCWRALRDFSHDAIVLVLASHEYDEADYLRDFDQFRAWEQSVATAPVPYIDLKRTDAAIGFQIRRAIDGVIASGTYVGGPAVQRFEDDFSQYCGTTHTVGVANGLDALSLALRAMAIGPGDEVIIPAHTFVATALAVTAVGATPCPVDVEYETGLLDVSKVEAAITARTKAVIPVHLYGHPVDMDPLLEIASRYGLRVLEDAAQAHGARYYGRRCGALGDAAAFSFYPTKNLGAIGDAGAVTASDPALADRVRKLANYGSSTKYIHEIAGGNSRLDPIQAAVLDVKLKHLDAWNTRREVLALRYLAGLRHVRGISLPIVRPWAEPVWHVFAVKIEGGRRDAVAQFLQQAGIGTNLHYPVPVTEQPCYAGNWNHDDFPNARRLARSLISLPLDPTHSDDEIDRVIHVLQKALAQTV